MSILDSRPEAMIFDLDGTLLDTEPLYTQASQRVLDPFGKTFDLRLKSRMMGGDARRSAKILIDHLSLPLSVDEYLRQRETHLQELFPLAREIEGAGKFLRRLSETPVTLGLATSSHSHLCRLKLGERDWVEHFHAIVCGDHPRLGNPKPAPDIFVLCAEMLETPPAACIAFEDSPNGVAAAIEAGMQVVAIASPWVDRQELSRADAIIDDYHQLLDLVGQWN